MPQPPSNTSQRLSSRRVDNGVSTLTKMAKGLPAHKEKEEANAGPKQDVAGLEDYRLGDCLGKGAFGSVYRALNVGTGQTVAVKQVKMTDLPKSELRVIMLEIDLLKNLNHPNIVKYHGFVKSTDSLYIILEYCENGSLHSICKNFGKFPENLVALYMAQVLHGLQYLHEQGVIHRDIKGANILTTKEGLVKLADFGVATTATGLHESSVVGTPYWMAPEVIELSGATTASDIWSLGCTVIELLDGKPPYHKLQPMPALFRIVNDDHPPLPESASPTVQDFLMQCFQKDPNLRVSAKKLLRHPWILNARRSDAVIPGKPTKYDEAIKSVKEWNEALQSPKGGSNRTEQRPGAASPLPSRSERSKKPLIAGPTSIRTDLPPSQIRTNSELYRSPEVTQDDNWDDDFASSISSTALQLPHLRPIDNFGGMLSSDKLKSYATFERPPINGWNDYPDDDTTLKSPLPVMKRLDPLETVRPHSPNKNKDARTKHETAFKMPHRLTSQPKTQILRAPVKLSQAAGRPHALKRTSSIFREDPVEDYSDLIAKDDVALDQKFHQVLQSKQTPASPPKFTHVSDLRTNSRSTKSSRSGGSLRLPSGDAEKTSHMLRTASSLEIQKYAENYEDEDFSDIFVNGPRVLPGPGSESSSERGITSMFNSKFSTTSWPGEDDDDDDPFAQLEENLDEMDLETKVARDKHVRLCALVESLIGSMKISQPEDVLADISEQLMQIVYEMPELRSVIMSSHGLLPILEVLENCQQKDTSLRLLKIINVIILDSIEIQENFCFVGGIPIVTRFAHKKYPSEIRLEAAAFVRQMYQTSTLTLQMFISCGGLNVLVEFLEEDYEAERDLVLIGVTGVWSVFELQGPTPKNDFCRIFSRSSVLYPLSLVLNRVLDEQGELPELVEGRIANIFYLFSQAENHVKESVADRMVLKRVLKDLRRMTPTHQITMLKFIKNLSMLATTLDSLQNSNAIEVLTDLLSSSMNLVHFRELSNQVLNIMFNLCRLSKTRQEDAALNGIIPLLQRIVQSDRPLKEFTLPILCDMAHSGKVGRKILWQNKGLNFYISLLAEPYWQVTALDAIFIWLQEETAKVEEHLLEGAFSKAIVECFIESKGDAFENLLEPLQKLLRLSPPVAAALAHPDLFSRTVQKLHNKKAVVRGNLLRIIRSICDANEEQLGLLTTSGLRDTVARLADGDPAILVRNMASELMKSSENAMRGTMEGSRYRNTRRTSSLTSTLPFIYSSSQPPTPQHQRVSAQAPDPLIAVPDSGVNRPQRTEPNGTPSRLAIREERLASDGSSGASASLGVKSRLPRTNLSRLSRSSASSKKEENLAPTPTPPGVSARSRLVLNPRRRQAGGA